MFNPDPDLFGTFIRVLWVIAFAVAMLVIALRT